MIVLCKISMTEKTFHWWYEVKYECSLFSRNALKYTSNAWFTCV